MDTTITRKPSVTTIQAGINETAFFKSMAHSFKSSFSFLGELMQNSRRAGATYVAFDFDPLRGSLIVTDDGSGIYDFAKLVKLSESGWENDVQLQDNPFGQGFFSVFFACQSVIVRSRDHVALIKLDEIQQKRLIGVHADVDGPIVGTVMELDGLDQTLCAVDPFGNYKLNEKLKKLALGFPIDVRLNGVSLDRPHAQQNLKGEQKHFGFVSCAHIHDEQAASQMPYSYANNGSFDGAHPALYLQGLPIQFDNSGRECCVVHLDNHVFAPVLPDRAYIFDYKSKIVLLDTALRQLLIDFLARQKHTVTPQQFTTDYWHACKSLNCMEMFNDIPLLPSSCFFEIEAITADYSSRHGHLKSTQKMVSLDDIQQGRIVAWRGERHDFLNDTNDGPIATFMMLQDIACVVTAGLHDDHWIFKHTVACDDLNATVEADTEVATGETFVGTSDVTIKLVKDFTVTVTSEVDSSFKMQKTVNDNWLVQSVGDDNESVVVYICENDRSSHPPFVALTDFCDEHERFEQDWYDRVESSWISLVSSMKGASLANSIGFRVSDLNVTISDSHIGQMLVLAAQKPRGYNRLAVVDLEKTEFWDAFASYVSNQSNPTPDGATLKALFAEAIGVSTEAEVAPSIAAD